MSLKRLLFFAVFSIVFVALAGCSETASTKSTATEVPILLYHHILEDKEFEHYKDRLPATNKQMFYEQMAFLKENGYRTITLDELYKFINGDIELPEKSVMIQFDDGLKSNYVYAYPILKEFGFTAVEYIITSRGNRPIEPFDPMSFKQFIHFDEIEDIDDVFEFGSHTQELHQVDSEGNYTSLIDVPTDHIINDLHTSLDLLYEHGVYDESSLRTIAYPFGRFNEETTEIVEQLGFAMGFTTKQGYVRAGDDPYTLKRFYFGPRTTMEDFKRIVQYEFEEE
ncbi:hypothetical protein EJF36_19515 [Bacillus sp. HMF5848]|uniref:polysaccharide deacetylase family protein n=1 Tax=Bacillus sp. HMF5848 TaxID=2495421 RepID=UPI000F7B4992|nr:polysaccharide deacetylase family protein [Bacillus sp. HMF5848]RSK28888.1 hypothetical protein EJF36_19515 [Bacillus sp. HMF5848]